MAIITNVQGKVTRKNGKSILRRQKLREDMVFEEKTLVLGDDASISMVLSDDTSLVVRGPYSSWTFPTRDMASQPDIPKVVTYPPTSGLYAQVQKGSGGNHMPSHLLVMLPQIVVRMSELKGVLERYQASGDLMEESLTHVRIAELASSINLGALSVEHSKRANDIADIIRSRITL
jgi:hypothetical protein